MRKSFVLLSVISLSGCVHMDSPSEMLKRAYKEFKESIGTDKVTTPKKDDMFLSQKLNTDLKESIYGDFILSNIPRLKFVSSNCSSIPFKENKGEWQRVRGGWDDIRTLKLPVNYSESFDEAKKLTDNFIRDIRNRCLIQIEENKAQGSTIKWQTTLHFAQTDQLFYAFKENHKYNVGSLKL